MRPRRLRKAIRKCIIPGCCVVSLVMVALLVRQQLMSAIMVGNMSLIMTHASSLSVALSRSSLLNVDVPGVVRGVLMDRDSNSSLPAGVKLIPSSKENGLNDKNNNNDMHSINQSPNSISFSNESELTTTLQSKGFSAADDSIPTVNLESMISCREQNCLIQNACFDSGETKQKPLRIRLFGNRTHVQSEWDKIRSGKHVVIGFRERSVQLSGMHGVDVSRIPAVIPSKSSSTFLIRWVNRNCGHDLGDGAVAAFRLMRLFPNVPDRLDRLIIIGRTDACNRVFEPLAKSVVIVNEYTPLLPANGTLECHGRIYFGVRGVSYMVDHEGTWPNRMSTVESDLKAFRDMYYRNAGILDNGNTSITDNTPDRDTIVIMEKRNGTHMSNLGNITEMADFLRREFPHRIQVVTWSDYESTKEQLKLMSRTRAMISLPGSDIMNGIFLQDGSALVLYCRLMRQDSSGTTFDDSNEVKFWFGHVSYVNASVEPCNSSNVSYNWTKNPVASTTFVKFVSLKARLVGLGVQPSVSR